MNSAPQNEQPNPLRFAAIDESQEASGIRRLHCRSYDDCLDVACARRWPGFTCAGCDAFVPRTVEERIWDAHKLIDLVAVVLAEEHQAGMPWPDEDDGVVTPEELQAEERRQQEAA